MIFQQKILSTSNSSFRGVVLAPL